MTFNPDDSKWTAYVAGELDAAERASVEKELAQSSEARALVAEIEKVIGVLVTQLKAEPLPVAPATMTIERTASAPAKPLPKGRLLYISVIGTAATAAAITAVAFFSRGVDSQDSRDVAMVSTTKPAESMSPTMMGRGKDATSSGVFDVLRAPAPDGDQLGENYGDRSAGGGVGGGSSKNGALRDAYNNLGTGNSSTIASPSSDTLDSPTSGRYRPNFTKPTYETKYSEDESEVGAPGSKPPMPFSNNDYRRETPAGNPPREAVDQPTSGPRPTAAPAPGTPKAKESSTGRIMFGVDVNSDSGLVGSAVIDETKPGQPASGEKAPGNKRSSLAPHDPASPALPTATPQPSTPQGEGRKSFLDKVEQSQAIRAQQQGRAPDANKPGEAAEHNAINGTIPNNSVANNPVPSASAAAPAPSTRQLPSDWSQKVEFAFNQPLLERGGKDAGGEAYEAVTDNVFMAARENPLSTFSIDVDTASYSNIRRFLTQNRMLPPPAAVRIEEMVNYFRYEYPQPDGETPFKANIEVASCPWNQEHRLVRVGIKGREIAANKRPPSNLVFLVDVSGSMSSPNKLPLVKEGLKMLTRQLTENDRVAIVVYAGSSGLVLPSTTGDKQQTILEALDRLEAGGSTNGAQGIQLSYEIALQNFLKGCTNRVILATDGDFNVGITDRSQLISLIEQQAKSGVFLTTLGFGMGNIKDATLEQLADKGNGAYAYVDDIREAKKVLVDEMSGTLVTIAKDVKIQIEFNPAEVGSYRLIGYENRIMKHEDFNNDQKDAGEIGAGHTVTALYEVVPVGQVVEERAAVDPLKYQPKPAAPKPEPVAGEHPGELMTLKLRYKQPDGEVSKLLEYPVKDGGKRWAQATGDFKFAASVALFGMILRNSPHKGTATLDAVIELAGEGRGSDESGYRQEFISLVQTAKGLGK